MDFREFQKQYNDYLMHAGMSIGERARGKDKPSRFEEQTIEDRRFVARYVKDPALRQVLMEGHVLHRKFLEAMEIAKGGYNDETKTRLIEGALREDYKNVAKGVHSAPWNNRK